MQDRCSHFRRRIVSVAERSVHQASSNDQITASQRGEKSCKAVFCPGNYLTELLRAKTSVLFCVGANILISVCVLSCRWAACDKLKLFIQYLYKHTDIYFLKKEAGNRWN